MSLRDRIEKDQGAMPPDKVIARLQAEIADRTVRQSFQGTKDGIPVAYQRSPFFPISTNPVIIM